MHILLAILLALPAQAQSLPKTIPFVDANGKPVGTATFNGNRIYLRDTHGVLLGTIVDERGHRLMFDPNGKQVDVLPFVPE